MSAFLTTAQVAEAFGVDTTTVHRMVAGGRLTSIAKAPGLRGAYLFDPEHVATVKAEREAEREAETAEASA